MKKLLNHLEEYVAAVVMMAMLALTFANVIMRNFSASISFTEEITTSLFVLLCMLGTAIAARDQEHLGLSILTELVAPRTRVKMAVVANVLGVIFSLVLLKTGIGMVRMEIRLHQISIALQIPQWIYGSFLPIGALCMACRFGQAAFRNLRALRGADAKERE